MSVHIWGKWLLIGWAGAIVASILNAVLLEPDAWAVNVILAFLAWQALALVIALVLFVVWLMHRRTMPGWQRWLSLAPPLLSGGVAALIGLWLAQG